MPTKSEACCAGADGFGAGRSPLEPPQPASSATSAAMRSVRATPQAFPAADDPELPSGAGGQMRDVYIARVFKDARVEIGKIARGDTQVHGRLRDHITGIVVATVVVD